MVVLGVNAYHADASAALLVDGELVAAAEEERFTRVKHTAGLPVNAVRYCLDAAGVTLEEVDHLAIPRDRSARLLHKLRYALRMPRFAWERARVWGEFGGIGEELTESLPVPSGSLDAKVHHVEHHLAHLASSFFVSPFERAAVLSLDGLGDFASGMWAIGEGNRLRVLGSVTFPHSLGLWYTAVTQYLGFPRYGDEYKVMGLAAHGDPDRLDAMRQIVRVEDGLGYELDLRHFTHHRSGAEMSWREGPPQLGRLYSPALEERLGPRRHREEEIDSRHRNVAASLQTRLEEVVVQQWRRLYGRTGLKDLAYAGGVAFNCVANGLLFQETPFERLYVQSAAGDAGLAVGAAYYVWHQVLGRPRSFVMEHAFWGPKFSDSDIRSALERRGVDCQRLEDDEIAGETAARVAEGEVVGWFQGRMEWGPRALGNRSIVADPRRREMREVLNRRVKYREPFRPFSPSVLEERVGEYYEQTHPSPFMLQAYRVRPEKRDEIPAPTHVDGTGRLQTVSRAANPRYWQLIEEFRRITGVPLVLNTSFNENEPIVCSPDEAVDCYLRTEMDCLVLGPFLARKRPEG